MIRVMIVDDVEIFRRDVKRLKIWGETSGFILAEEAKDGQEALDKLEAGSIDVVITDIKMPKMGGIELLQKIAERNLCPFTVLLSDYTEYNYAKQGFLYGAFDYLGKPVDEKELLDLLERIEKLLDEKKRQEETLRVLQGIAEDALYMAEETKQAAMLIQKGDPKASSFISNMLDSIGIYDSSDRQKTLLILQKAVHAIIDETLKTRGWIGSFLDIDELKTADYSSCTTWAEVKGTATDILEKLITIVSRLMGSQNNKIVIQACEYTLGHIDEELSVKTVSEKLFINKSYLSEVFKQQFGITILEYITMVKMERAKKLLCEGNLKNYEIAEMLGFKDNEYFSRLFKKYTGMLPKDFTKS